MSATLEDLLKAGADALAESRKKADAEKAEAARRYNEYQAAKLEMAKMLVPEALRQYASIAGGGLDEALVVTLPNGATVQHTINVLTDGGWGCDETFRAVELAKNRRTCSRWVAYKWALSDGEATYWPAIDRDSLETALATAVELYSEREEVEKLAADWQARRQAREPKPVPVASYYCPIIKDDCMKEACAWWIEASGSCAVWALGENAWDVFHKRALE